MNRTPPFEKLEFVEEILAILVGHVFCLDINLGHSLEVATFVLWVHLDKLFIQVVMLACASC